MIFLPPEVPAGVTEAWVGVETDGTSWQLRVTEHGGTHWLRNVATEGEARGLVESYLRDPIRPPGDEWTASTE